MWLIKSSIGRKVVMAVTGMALILFLTFHCAMNIVALFSKEGYNMICELLGCRSSNNRTGSPGNNTHCVCLYPAGAKPPCSW